MQHQPNNPASSQIAAQPGTVGPDRPASSLTRDEKEALFRRGTSLILMGIVLIVCVGVVSVIILRRHRRRILARVRASKKRRPPPDPWFESGRRTGPRGEGGAGGSALGIDDDDTVDLDPDELDDFDVEGDEGRGGNKP